MLRSRRAIFVFRNLGFGTRFRRFVCAVISIFSIGILTACGGGGSSSSPTPTPTPPPVVTPPPPPPLSEGFKTDSSTVRFLNRATFGSTTSQMNSLMNTEASTWLVNEFNKPATLYRTRMTQLVSALPQGEMLFGDSVTNLYIDAAIAADDQLRQRMVLALSEIIVASSNSALDDTPEMLANYVDILSTHAFGNYRDLLEAITYSPAMGQYLTYMMNQKGDPLSGRMPDENYAREIMQLFTIGLNELNMDGSMKLDTGGIPIETYDNNDITGLAKVFTGLSLDNNGHFFNFYADKSAWYKPMVMFAEHHSQLEKTFLGTTIAANTDGATSIDTALDTIFNHPNVAPFFARQLIQKFVTSHPEPAYIERVATAFETGRYNLPNNVVEGTGVRGDLRATLAAVLMDDNAVRLPQNAPAEFGKVREPMLRVFQWARVFNETTPDASDEWAFYDMNSEIGQHPFRANSVFNFFRPGYVAPGSATGAAGLTAPELQIINESSSVGYVNFINGFIYSFNGNKSETENGGVTPSYSRQYGLVANARDLIDDLDLILTGNMLSDEAKDRMVEILNEIPVNAGSEDQDNYSRVVAAVSMVMTSPGYLVQR